MRILVIVFLTCSTLGCVSAGVRDRIRTTDSRIEHVEAMRAGTEDPEVLASLEIEHARLISVRAEQAIQATSSRVDSVSSFTVWLGTLMGSLSPLLAFLGVPGGSAIASSIGTILKSFKRGTHGS